MKLHQYRCRNLHPIHQLNRQLNHQLKLQQQPTVSLSPGDWRRLPLLLSL